MARQYVLVCDAPGSTKRCNSPATTYHMWRNGDMEAHALDLCEEHAKPFQVFFELGMVVDLPAKPRIVMKKTKLRPTKTTKSLKLP